MAVSVRVIRDGHAEVFALARSNGSKLGGFKPLGSGKKRGLISVVHGIESFLSRYGRAGASQVLQGLSLA